jgi:hypothetical protein
MILDDCEGWTTVSKPPNKYQKAYIANHLYSHFPGRWPEKDWNEGIRATDGLYFAYIELDPRVADHTLDLYRVIMDLHGI